MAKEWRQICNSKNFDFIGYLIASLVFMAVLSASFLNVYFAILILILGLVLLPIIELFGKGFSKNTVFWSLLGSNQQHLFKL